MARAVLRWSQRKLAKVANVSAGTVARFEGGAALKAGTVEAIQYALEKSGVDFISADDGGPGANLRK
jgi:transcriptional regulator with XRE-family HTH domain